MSEIVDGARCFLHITACKGSEQLKQVDEKMKALTKAEGLTGKLAYEPRRGNIVAAVFDDGENGPLWCVFFSWAFNGVGDPSLGPPHSPNPNITLPKHQKNRYRARVEEKLPNNGGYRVLFIDYGNRAAVPADKLRTLDGAHTAIPPQAKEAALAFLRAPAVGDDYGQEAGQAFAALAWGKALKARVLAREGAVLVVSLTAEGGSGGGGKTVNQEMAEQVGGEAAQPTRCIFIRHGAEACMPMLTPIIETHTHTWTDPSSPPTTTHTHEHAQGLARVSKRADRLASKLAPGATNLVADLKEAQEVARKGRLGMWRYGDVADSDDEGY